MSLELAIQLCPQGCAHHSACSAPTAHIIWTAIHDQFRDNELHRTVYLEAEFRNLVQADMEITQYTRRLKHLADDLREVGQPVHEISQVLNMPQGLSSKYRHAILVITAKQPPHTFLSARSYCYWRSTMTRNKPRPLRIRPSSLPMAPAHLLSEPRRQQFGFCLHSAPGSSCDGWHQRAPTIRQENGAWAWPRSWQFPAPGRFQLSFCTASIPRLGTWSQPVDRDGPGVAHAVPRPWRGRPRSLSGCSSTASLPRRCATPISFKRRSTHIVLHRSLEPPGTARGSGDLGRSTVGTAGLRMVPQHGRYLSHGVSC